MNFTEAFYAIAYAPKNVEAELGYYVTASFAVAQLVYVLTDWYWSDKQSYKSLPKVEQVEWQTRVVSTLHAVVVFPIVVYVLWTDEKYNNDPTWGRNKYSDIAMALGVGYFFADFLMVVRYQIEPIWPIVAHHVFAGWGFLLAIGSEGAGRWFGCYLLLTEGTTPFNNTHWHLTKAGLQEHRITKLIGYLFTMSWVIFRLAINPLLLYRLYAHWHDITARPHIAIVLLTNVTFLVLLNTIHFITGPFYELVFGVKKAVKEVVKEVNGKSR